MNTQPFQTTCIIFLQLTVVGLLVFSACGGDDVTGSDEPEDHGVVEIAIEPREATFEAGDQQDFSVFALNADGDTIDISDLDIEWEWWSTDPDVFTVEPGGLATGQSTGEAFCVVEATVSVSQNIVEELDIMYAGINFNVNMGDRTETNSLKLLLEDPELMKSEKTAYKKKRLRFTGRDSAFVMVF